MSLPSLLTGLRNGFTLSVTGAVVGEFVMGGEGLGMVLSVQSNSADTTGLFATLSVLSVLAVLMYGLLREVERLILHDRPTVRRHRRLAIRRRVPHRDDIRHDAIRRANAPATAQLNHLR